MTRRQRQKLALARSAWRYVKPELVSNVVMAGGVAFMGPIAFQKLKEKAGASRMDSFSFDGVPVKVNPVLEWNRPTYPARRCATNSLRRFAPGSRQ